MLGAVPVSRHSTVRMRVGEVYGDIGFGVIDSQPPYQNYISFNGCDEEEEGSIWEMCKGSPINRLD